MLFLKTIFYFLKNLFVSRGHLKVFFFFCLLKVCLVPKILGTKYLKRKKDEKLSSSCLFVCLFIVSKHFLEKKFKTIDFVWEIVCRVVRNSSRRQFSKWKKKKKSKTWDLIVCLRAGGRSFFQGCVGKYAIRLLEQKSYCKGHIGTCSLCWEQLIMLWSSCIQDIWGTSLGFTSFQL